MRYKVINNSSKEEWLAQRAQRVTATDLKKIKSGTTKAFDKLWREKRGASTFRGNRFTKWGNEREPFIAQDAQESFASLNLLPNAQLLADVDEPRFAATPDMIGTDHIAELKTCLVKNIAADDCTAEDVYLTKYADQVQWQLMVTGADACVFGVEFYTEEDGEFIPRFIDWYLVKPDPKAIGELVDVAAKFLDYKPADIEQDDDFELQSLIVEIRRCDDELARLRREVKLAQDARSGLLENLFELKGQESTSFKSGGMLVEIKGGSLSNRFDRKALAKEYPEIEQKFVVQSATSPRVTVTELEVA